MHLWGFGVDKHTLCLAVFSVLVLRSAVINREI